MYSLFVDNLHYIILKIYSEINDKVHIFIGGKKW